LAVVESVSSQVAVMYLGTIVESGSTETIFSDSRHPYTLALLASVPSPDPEHRSEGAALGGDVPSAIQPPSGCRFHPRCKFRMDVCEQETPPLTDRLGRRLACHLPDEFDLTAEQEAARRARATAPVEDDGARPRARPLSAGEVRMRRRW